MPDVTINLTFTQRIVLIRALSYYQDYEQTRSVLDMDELDLVNELRAMVAKTPCGDPYCSICGSSYVPEEDNNSD